MTDPDRVREATERAQRGNLEKEGEKLARQGKLFVRDRLARLLDEDSFAEDALLANALAGDLPADGVITGTGRVDGRPVCVVANDPTVKAGSWGARTVEKIVRLTEHALRHELPVVYLVDSAGARITDQVELFPGRRGAGRIFANQVRLSGKVPQVCCLFGPSAAGGAYIPAFCDVVFMVEGNASMYLGSPRMAEVVIGEHISLEEMGGARMHATVSGCGDNLCADDDDAIDQARRFLSYLPTNWTLEPPADGTGRSDRIGEADSRHGAGRGAARVRHAQRGRCARRCGLVLRDQAAVGARADRRLRSPRRAARRHRRQQPETSRGSALRRLCRQGRALHLAVRRVQRAARLPRRRSRVHDRLAGRAGRDHPSRRQDDHRRRRSHRAEVLRHRAQGVRRGFVRDVRACVRSRRLPRAADRADRRDGSGPGGERRVLQQDPRDRRRRRTQSVRRREAPRVRGRRRPAPPRCRARGRRDRAARRPARRARRDDSRSRWTASATTSSSGTAFPRCSSCPGASAATSSSHPRRCDPTRRARSAVRSWSGGSFPA